MPADIAGSTATRRIGEGLAACVPQRAVAAALLDAAAASEAEAEAEAEAQLQAAVLLPDSPGAADRVASQDDVGGVSAEAADEGPGGISGEAAAEESDAAGELYALRPISRASSMSEVSGTEGSVASELSELAPTSAWLTHMDGHRS